jgi:DNA-binding beta-propeller fold protein YncE
MRSFALLGTLLAACAPLSTSYAQAIDAVRAAVTDHASNHVSVVDVATGRVLQRFETGSPGGLRHGATLGEVSLSQGAAGRVDIVALGISVEGHGDHSDVRLSSPRLIARIGEGPRPSHVLGGDGRVASFFDGDGSIVVFESGVTRRLSANVPHHGLAYPFRSSAGRRLMVSHAQAAGDRPGGVVVLNNEGGEITRRDDCPRLHGEAISGQVIGVGCADGVLLLNTRTEAFRKIPYPADTAGDRMVRNLIGGVDFHLFVGDFGPTALVILDPNASAFTPVELPARRLAFTMDPQRADAAFALTEDGRIHRINTLTGSIAASATVTRRYSLEGGSAVARPRISAAGGLVVVTDPSGSRLLVLDAETLAARREIAIGGAPLNVIAVAASGEQH